MAGTQTSNSKRPASDTAVGPAARVSAGAAAHPGAGVTGAVALVRRPRPLLLARRSGTRVSFTRHFYSAQCGHGRGAAKTGAAEVGQVGAAVCHSPCAEPPRRAASGPAPPPSSGSVWPRRLSSVSAAGLRWVCGGSGFRSGLRVRRRLPVSIGRLGRVRLPVSVIDVRHRCPELGPASGLGSDSLPVRGRVRCLVSVIGVRHRCLGRVRFPVWDQIHFRSRVGSSFRCLSSALVIGVWVESSFRSGVRSTSVRGRVRCLVSVVGVRHRCLGRVQLPVRVRVHLLVRGRVRLPVSVIGVCHRCLSSVSGVGSTFWSGVRSGVPSASVRLRRPVVIAGVLASGFRTGVTGP